MCGFLWVQQEQQEVKAVILSCVHELAFSRDEDYVKTHGEPEGVHALAGADGCTYGHACGAPACDECIQINHACHIHLTYVPYAQEA